MQHHQVVPLTGVKGLLGSTRYIIPYCLIRAGRDASEFHRGLRVLFDYATSCVQVLWSMHADICSIVFAECFRSVSSSIITAVVRVFFTIRHEGVSSSI